MADIACSVVNDLFERESGRFGIDVHERYSLEDPWGRLVRVGAFPQGIGTTIGEITIERVLSGSFEDDWDSVGTSDGTTTSSGCAPDPEDLEFGQTVRTWNLQTKSYQTPCICLDDLKTSFQIKQQTGKTVDQLTFLTKTVLSNRRRSEFARLTNTISMGLPFGTEYSTLAATPPPTAQISQDFLDMLRLQLIANGASHNALGMENGAPVLGLILGPDTSRNLLRNNPDLRQDIRFATPSELVAPLGVERSFGGYYHISDFEVARYDHIDNAWVRRYPMVSSSTTTGIKWEPSALYYAAQYERVVVFHPDVYEEAVQQVGPDIPGAPFNDYPYYYSGQFFWLNIISGIPGAGYNPLGKIGRWLGIWQNGSRPIAPYLGKTIMVKRCPNDLSMTGCVYES